jgi:ERCC4-type nuclease
VLLHQITVDSREQTPRPEETLERLASMGVNAVVGTLPAGDFRWVVEPDDPQGDWWVYVVERKSIKDLVASVDDGRLARFIDETGGATPPPTQIRVLLIEGDVEAGLANYRGRDWSAEALASLMVDAQMLGVVCVQSPSVRSTPGRIANLWRWSGKDSHKALLRPVLPGISDDYLDPRKKAAVRSLMVYPGWGEVRARAVLRYFGSPGKALAALLARDYEAFKAVPGIGKGLVVAAADFLEAEV